MKPFFQLMGPVLVVTLFTACENLGWMTVACQGEAGDSAVGGGGNTNPAQCDAIAFASQSQVALSTSV